VELEGNDIGGGRTGDDVGPIVGTANP
jgi:hypothetical protein